MQLLKLLGLKAIAGSLRAPEGVCQLIRNGLQMTWPSLRLR